ncbi:hypothetical protein M9458_021288, partial [Cirrhinus mrigala]
VRLWSRLSSASGLSWRNSSPQQLMRRCRGSTARSTVKTQSCGCSGAHMSTANS